MGRARPELKDGARSFPIGRFMIFYEIRKNKVYILHVVGGAMDVEELFQD